METSNGSSSEQPQETKASKRRGFSWLGGVCLGILGLVLVSVPLLTKINQSRLGEFSKEPESLTVSQLIQRGPKGNAHLTLTDFEISRAEVVKVGTKTAGLITTWEYVLIPIHPSGERTKTLHIVVKGANVTQEKDIEQLLQRKSLTGLIINVFDSIPHDAQKLLRQNNPDTDFDSTILFQPDRSPPGTKSRHDFVIVGVILTVLALILWYFGSWRDFVGMIKEELTKVQEKNRKRT